MKKLLYSLALVAFVSTAYGQTAIDETFDLKGIEALDLVFEYPELVKIKVWDKDEVRVTGSVDINAGQDDEDFELRANKNDGTLTIRSKIKNLGKHKRTVIYSDDDDDDDDENHNITITKNGTSVRYGSRNRYSRGTNVSIVLEVTIPRQMEVMLDARYGMVEIVNSPEDMEVDATYGGVDITVDENASVDIAARTQWGQIYSNLKIPMKVGGNDMPGQWMKASASLKSGKNRLQVESQYGNVYLRKQ